jgi:hypothetical protein
MSVRKFFAVNALADRVAGAASNGRIVWTTGLREMLLRRMP